ncbi:ketoacyl-ACP synthase III [Pseudonocardiaceae bacterium YIM PH 21723]|nr:ketoacyl-ACP synthase III [Pseudonocardiaceae bacterium YIM PH 21723]
MTELNLTPSRTGSRILGFGSYQPERRVTNDELAQEMDTNDEWIRSRVGVIERRLSEPGQTLVDLAVEAGKNAVTDSGLTPSEIDTVIVATCTMETNIPNAAAQTAHRIGIQAAAAFDLNAACAGFSYGLGTASDFVRVGSAKNVLVIGVDKFTNWVDYTDRSTAIIFGDGAGAAVVGPSDTPQIGPAAWGSAGDLAEMIYVKDRNSFIFQEGQSVFRWATTKIAPIALEAVKRAGVDIADIDVLVPHQANLRIIEAIGKGLRKHGARTDLKVATDIQYSGNTSAASIPMAIDHMRAAGEIKSGELALLVGFGAGLSYGAQVVVCP